MRKKQSARRELLQTEKQRPSLGLADSEAERAAGGSSGWVLVVVVVSCGSLSLFLFLLLFLVLSPGVSCLWSLEEKVVRG